MERETKEITLPKSGYKVYVVKSLLYGEHVAINKAIYDSMEIGMDGSQSSNVKASVLFDQNKLKFSTCVKKIIDSDGNDVKVSPEALDMLPFEDGLFIIDEINKILDHTKKK